jgi:hypothetical protein
MNVMAMRKLSFFDVLTEHVISHHEDEYDVLCGQGMYDS